MASLLNKKKIEAIMNEKKNISNNNKNTQKLEDIISNSKEIETEKKELIDRLQNKITNINDKKVITEMKQSSYKKLFDAFNILILLLSTILTIIEAIKNDVDVERTTESKKQFFKLSPIIIATSIGFITAIIKFKRFQEKLEINTKAIEKSIFTTFRMKKLQEDIYFANEDKFLKLKEIYKEEIFPLYNQAQGDLESILQFKDLIKYSAIKKRLENKGNKTLLQLHNKEVEFNNNLYNELHNTNIEPSNKPRRNSKEDIMNEIENEIIDIGDNLKTTQIENRPPTPFNFNSKTNVKYIVKNV
jgi:hypothetical protein